MKRLLLLSGLGLILASCQPTPPKETAQQFIQSLAATDITTASSLATNNTKPLLDKAKKEAAPATSAEELFQLSTLIEEKNGDKAVVKNEIIALPLVKESEGWRVVLTEALLNEIQNREAMLTAVKTKWDELQKEYTARKKILEGYIAYKKSSGVLSPKLRALSEAVSSLPAESEWTREKLVAYTEKQQQLNGAIDGALEPSMAANTDLTLTYFLQISQAGDRIKAAEAAYQSKAKEAHSAVYVPLPHIKSSEAKVASN
jgi:hypothetical protein